MPRMPMPDVKLCKNCGDLVSLGYYCTCGPDQHFDDVVSETAAECDELNTDLVRILDHLVVHVRWLRENHHDLLPRDYEKEGIEEWVARTAVNRAKERDERRR